MRVSFLLFLPLIAAQPCRPSIRPLQQKNIPILSIPCPDSRPLIPYVRSPFYLRRPRVNPIEFELQEDLQDDDEDVKDDDDEEDDEDLEYVEID